MIADQFFYPSTLNAKTHLTQDNRMAYELELKHILSLDIRNLLIYIYPQIRNYAPNMIQKRK